MRPNQFQYFVARGMPEQIWFLLIGVGGIVFAVKQCEPSWSAFSDWKYCLLFSLAVLIAPLLAGLVTLPLMLVFVLPFYEWANRLNGAPFQIGDSVRILAGRHAGQVTQVYEIWDCRHQVRLEIDADAKERVEDVYSYTQICREKSKQL